MNAEKIGKAILFLRTRAGLTQKMLAEKLGVSDKAVSRWERGVGIPGISLLRRLSVILDTDIDSLLEGSVTTHETSWKGLLFIDKDPSMIICDKPFSDYIISYFLLMKIRNIIMFGDNISISFMKNKYGNGENLGISVLYCYISDGENLSHCLNRNQGLLTQSKIMAILASSIIYGVNLSRFLYRGMISPNRITTLMIAKNDDNKELWIDDDKKVIRKTTTANVPTRYRYCVLPFFIFERRIRRYKTLFI